MASPISYTDNLEQQSELKTFSATFASAPEIYGLNEFILDKDPNILLVAESLASEAKYLINIFKTTLPSNIYNEFQIELRKVNTHNDQCLTYKMSLRIDSLLWFKHHTLHGRDVQNLEKLYKLGSDYVENVKSETEHHPETLNEDEIERIPINSSTSNWCHIEQRGEKCKRNEERSCPDRHYLWCPDENYGITGECTQTSGATAFHNKLVHTSTIDKNDKPAYQCRYPITKLNRIQTMCLFRVNPNFWIYQNKVIKSSSYPYFIVAARNDATSVITLNPVKHCRNEEYVQTCDAWQAVLQTLMRMKDKLKLDKLPLHRIYVNFGKWMQQKQDDLTRRNCHAHINIVLTRQAIEKINDSYRPKDKFMKSKILFPSLVGSVLPPKAHRLDDAFKLIEHMDYSTLPLLTNNKNRELVRSISYLKSELEILRQEYEKLRQLVFGPTHDAQEADELAHGTDTDDVGTGINDSLLMQGSSSNSDLEYSTTEENNK